MAADGNRNRDPQSDIICKKESNLQISIKSLPSYLREYHEKWCRKIVRTREDGGHEESELNKQGIYEIRETEAASIGPMWVYARFFTYVL